MKEHTPKSVTLNGVELQDVHSVKLEGRTNFGKPVKWPEGELTFSFTLKSRPQAIEAAAARAVLDDIKAEISKRIASLSKPDFNAAAEIVGAVLNDFIDRGLLLEDDHELTDMVADVLEGMSVGPSFKL